VPAGTYVIVTFLDGTTAAEATADTTGRWSADLTPPNAGGDAELEIVSVMPDGTYEMGTATAAFGSTVTVDGPADGDVHPGGRLALNGSGEAGADIYVTRGAEVLAVTTVRGDETWEAAAVLGSIDATLTVMQFGRGANMTTDDVAVRAAATPPLLVTYPGDGTVTVAPSGRLEYRGSAPAGAAIRVLDDARAEIATATAGASGSWRASVPVHRGVNALTIQATTTGAPIELQHRITVGPLPADDLVLTSPQAGDTFTADTVVRFTGTGAPGATVRLEPGGGLTPVSTTVRENGDWTIDRYLGGGAYTFTLVQDDGGAVTRIGGIALTPAGTPVDLAFEVTTPTAGDEIRSEVATFTGTGRHGETVTITVASPAGLAVVSGEVRQDGTWSIDRYLGDGPYSFDVVQTAHGVETGAERDLRINQPARADDVTGPFTVTAPTTGTTFVAASHVEFSGTGTTGSTVTITPTNGLAPVTTVVEGGGLWKVSRFLGNGPYTFQLNSVSPDGHTEAAGDISLTPAP
jgi:hypothetical protein